MTEVDGTLSNAEKELAEVLAQVDHFLAGLTPAHRMLALCGVSLFLMWRVMRGGIDRTDKGSMYMQFGLAFVLVVLFGAGVGAIFGPPEILMDWIS